MQGAPLFQSNGKKYPHVLLTQQKFDKKCKVPHPFKVMAKITLMYDFFETFEIFGIFSKFLEFFRFFSIFWNFLEFSKFLK